MLRQDFIGRLIKQLGEALARIAGLRKQGASARAEAEIAAAERALGLIFGAERLDAKSVASLLGSADKVVLAAMLLEQRALLSEEKNDPLSAQRYRKRALKMMEHCCPDELCDEAAQLRTRLVG